MNTQTNQLEQYKKLRSIPLGTLDAAKIVQASKELAADGRIKDAVKYQASVGILHKVAHQTDEKQWTQFCITGEMPPVKLTAEEMNLLQGGTFGLLSCFAAGLTLGVTIYEARDTGGEDK